MAREYPGFPRVGVGAIVFRDDALLLVQRKFEPSAGYWTLPGGLVKLGETLQQAVQREIAEECSIQVKPKKIVDVFDVIEHDEENRTQYHYVIVDFEAEYISGRVAPGSDVTQARWVPTNQLSTLDLPEITKEFLTKHYNEILR